jgi:hypothetical protein
MVFVSAFSDVALLIFSEDPFLLVFRAPGVAAFESGVADDFACLDLVLAPSWTGAELDVDGFREVMEPLRALVFVSGLAPWLFRRLDGTPPGLG